MSKINLFDFQAETLDAVRAKLRELKAEGKPQRLILYAPTGAGKTEMAMAMLEATHIKGNRGGMVLDRVILCEQTSARLDKYGIPHGVLQAGHWRHRLYELIQVCSAQTLEKRGSLPGMKIMFVDECHDTRKMTVEFMKNNPDVMVVGLSASPFTKGLKSIYGEVVGATSTANLVELGRLVPLRVFVGEEANMAEKKPRGGEWTVNDAGDAGIKIVGDVVEEWRDKCTDIFGGPRKTIVFAANIAHGAELAKNFAERGYNFVQISYEDSDDFKRDAVAEFKKPDTSIHGLIACDILTKGFDVPDVMVGISARPFKKSFSSHVQQMGRIMRCSPGKEFGLWLDHSGNYLRFQEKWDSLYVDGVRTLDDEGQKAAKELTSVEKEKRKCPKCHAVWIGAGRVCKSCGHERPLFNEVKHVDGKLGELGVEASKSSMREREQWYLELRTVIRERGRDDGYVAMVFKEKFGMWPPYSWRDRPYEPTTVTPEVASYEHQRRVNWARKRSYAAAKR
jgi:DNA repair protein RadD